MKESPEPDDSPYEAPEAPLESDEEMGGFLSATAFHYLVSAKWWMVMAAVALMANGAIVVLMVFLTLAKVERLPVSRKLMLCLFVVVAHMIFLPGLRLMQSALTLGKVKRTKEEADVAYALGRHEEFWKLLGIAFLLAGGLLFFLVVFSIR